MLVGGHQVDSFLVHVVVSGVPSMKSLVSRGRLSLHHTSCIDALETSNNRSLVTLVISKSTPLIEEGQHDAIYNGTLSQLRELSIMQDIGIRVILVWPAKMLSIDCRWSIRLPPRLLQ